jgi:hypothetical protein
MRLIEWVGSLMFLVALIDFAASPKRALQSIPQILATNPKMVHGHLVIPKHNLRSKEHTR